MLFRSDGGPDSVVADDGERTMIAPVGRGWGEWPRGRGRNALVTSHVAVALVVPRAVMHRGAGVAVAVALAVSVGLVGVAVLVRRGRVGRSAAAGTSGG